MLDCPPFYKRGVLATGRPGCVPSWDPGYGTAGIIQDGESDADEQARLERETTASKARMDQAGAAYVDAAKAGDAPQTYARTATPVPSSLQSFIIYGVGLILLVVAFNRLLGA